MSKMLTKENFYVVQRIYQFSYIVFDAQLFVRQRNFNSIRG